MNKSSRFWRAGSAAIALALLAGFASTPSLAGGVVVKVDGDGSIGLSNLDSLEEEAAPVTPAALVAMPSAPGAPVATGEQSAIASQAEKPEPLVQHRLDMMQQAKPENYMGANQAVSRRYLMVDKATYQSRIQQ
jgi:hypothetical protein